MDKALAFLTSVWSVPPGAVRLEPIQGGLESSVARGTLVTDHGVAPGPKQFVVKELRGRQRREVSIYRSIWQQLAEPPAARVIGIHRGGDVHYLVLEDVETVCPWPWREHDAAAAVCRELARLHDSRGIRLPVPSWDYEADLRASAASTLDAATRLRDPDGRLSWTRPGELRRVVDALPAIRALLLGRESVVLHGDVHPGNVMLRPRARPEGQNARPEGQNARPEGQNARPDLSAVALAKAEGRAYGEGRRVALIDWARARVGSPLEDIASWLHSLGCWEPESRRRHDSLLRAYLAARAVPQVLTRDLREAYWLASACNGLSGAIRYNLAVLADPQTGEAARRDARRALDEWQRLMRGAAAILRQGVGR
jgi:aminoglycoside phosphotransferase (APT) family kinase protein